MRNVVLRGALVLLLAVVATAAHTRSLARPRIDQPTRIEFLDVGQGDSVLIQSPEGKTALIDAGTSNQVVATLKQRGITSIDLVAVSHHHSDHYGGMRAVIKEFRPKYFLATTSSHTTASYLKLLEAVRDQNLVVVHPTKKPRRIELGSIVMTVLPQPPEVADEENNNSIGIRVDDGSISVLLTGDSEEAERQWWVKNYPGLLRDVTILKLAHHGSRNGTDARWLNLVRPELTVASLGKGNDYGHPHAETLSLLARREIPLKRTDLEGTVAIESDGRRWNLVRDQLAGRSETAPKGKGWRTSSRSPAAESSKARRR